MKGNKSAKKGYKEVLRKNKKHKKIPERLKRLAKYRLQKVEIQIMD